ncbi:serine/threonine protein kinase [Shewanella psychropiezotolerans]|uniref:Stress response kinase A n=1 Tax=Shewanella psychropiezotolerans TaxID=2593655 RepID=A0ABX5X3Y9_9GAMM|nr:MULTISPECIES: serine/threonine protein kinase [Shewanella]MPY25583.1 serine/threonine protein kinase [Shewanella sp. YLB-07]QDO86070.1 serine/threonine protein kinase [Shewanella psychropiezotolerans]
MSLGQTGSGLHYQALTPDLILDAIESLDIFPETGLLALNSYENRVYQFRCDNGVRYVVKFYRPERWSNAQIQEEHDFSQALFDEEIPIATPLIINDRSLHEYKGFRFALFPSIGGRAFEVDNLEQLEATGRFIGRIHQYSKQGQFAHRDLVNPQVLGDESLLWLKESGHVPSSLVLPYFTIVEQVLDKSKEIWNQQNPKHIRLHGDLHPGNILWTPDGPGFVDLDDARTGPAIQDLWMMITGDSSQRQLQLEILLEAYEEFCEFDAKELRLIEPLRAMRMLHYNAWLSRRWEDPAFPMNFPWYAEERYWEQQILSFKEQLAILNEPALSLIPGY